MKNIKIALLLMAILCITYNANAQIKIEAGTKTYSEVFDSLSTGLIPSRIPCAVLYDRVYGWSGLENWQSGDTTSVKRLMQSWYDIEQSYFDSLLRPNRYVNMRTKMQEKIHAVNLATC